MEDIQHCTDFFILLDHMVVLCLVFQGISILFSIVAAPIYIPTNSVPYSPQPLPSHRSPYSSAELQHEVKWGLELCSAQVVAHNQLVAGNRAATGAVPCLGGKPA